MVGVASNHVFNTKVVDDKNKNNWAPFVALEPGSCGRFIITIFGEAFTAKIISPIFHPVADRSIHGEFQI